MENNTHYWHRSKDKVIAGVCGGIAAKLNVDPVVVRLVFVLLAFFGGGGLLAYIILWIVLPEYPYGGPNDYADYSETKSKDFDGFESKESEPNFEYKSKKYDYEPIKKDAGKTQLIIGSVMIGFGALFLLANFIPNLDLRDFWPAALIVIGLFLLLPSRKN